MREIGRQGGSRAGKRHSFHIETVFILDGVFKIFVQFSVSLEDFLSVRVTTNRCTEILRLSSNYRNMWSLFYTRAVSDVVGIRPK